MESILYRRRLTGTLAAVVAILIMPSLSDAQRIAFEGGLGVVQNYDPAELSFGVSASVPMTETLLAAASYTWWGGEDGNLAYTDQGTDLTFGDRGIHFVLLYRSALWRKFEWYNGGGMSQYAMMEQDGAISHRRWFGATTFTTLLRYRMAEGIAMQVRGDLSSALGNLGPSWGFLRFGLEVAPATFQDKHIGKGEAEVRRGP